MKIEKIITLIFIFFGCIAGFFSNYFKGLFSFVSLVFYVLPALFLYKNFKGRDIRKILTDGLITFLLIWIFVWTLLYNI